MPRFLPLFELRVGGAGCGGVRLSTDGVTLLVDVSFDTPDGAEDLDADLVVHGAGRIPNLASLGLAQTRVSDTGLVHLADHKKLSASTCPARS